MTTQPDQLDLRLLLANVRWREGRVHEIGLEISFRREGRGVPTPRRLLSNYRIISWAYMYVYVCIFYVCVALLNHEP